MEDFKDIQISWKTAVRAKEKGFFCICPHRFLNEHTKIGGWLNTTQYQPTKKDIEQYVKDPCELPIASTQQILREWIERELKLSVLVDYEVAKDKILYFAKILNRHKVLTPLSARFEAYKDAMEDGLFTALS